jgi:hypothetical protein
MSVLSKCHRFFAGQWLDIFMCDSVSPQSQLTKELCSRVTDVRIRSKITLNVRDTPWATCALLSVIIVKRAIHAPPPTKDGSVWVVRCSQIN